MNKADLVSAVSEVVQDTSWTSAKILAILNRGLLEIAGGGNRNWGLPLCGPLPDLLTSGTIATDTNNNVSLTSLTTAYHRDLFRVTDASGNKIKIYQSFMKFMDDYQGLTKNGTVEAVALKGNTLYYQGVPSAAQTLTLWYYMTPTPLTTEASTPSCLPDWLHYRLLVNYAAMEIFSKIEDGIDGAKVNTAYHTNEYQLALTDLHRFIGTADKEPIFIRDDADYIEEDY